MHRSSFLPVLVGLLAASPTGALAAGPLPPDVTVEVRSISYAPSDITVPRGTRVVWDNVTSPDRVHDVVSSIPDVFESGRFHAGETFAHRFTAAGTFTYICSIHDLMIGAVHVPLTGRIVERPEGAVMRIRLATEPLPSGSPYRYVVWRRDPGSDDFVSWLSTIRKAAEFRPSAPGTYEFVMRVRNAADGHRTGPGGDSPVLSLEWPG